MKVLKHTGQWLSYKLDSIAKIFITKEDLLDMSIDEQKDNIQKIKEGLVGIRTARKDLQVALKENKTRLIQKEARIKQYLRKKKEDNAKIELRAKLEIEKQNDWLETSVEKMKEKEKLTKLKLEKLKQMFEISRNNAEFYKSMYAVSRSNLNIVDVGGETVNLNEVMNEMKKEIQTMDNRIESIDELEQEGVLESNGVGQTSDFEVEEALEAYKKKVK